MMCFSSSPLGCIWQFGSVAKALGQFLCSRSAALVESTSLHVYNRMHFNLSGSPFLTSSGCSIWRLVQQLPLFAGVAERIFEQTNNAAC